MIQTGASLVPYLGPFGVELSSFGGILEGVSELGELDVGGGAVGVENVVVGVEGDGLRVEGHRCLEVPGLAGGVTLPHLLQEERLRPAALTLAINLQLQRGEKSVSVNMKHCGRSQLQAGQKGQPHLQFEGGARHLSLEHKGKRRQNEPGS